MHAPLRRPAALYGSIFRKTVPMSTPAAAEMTKLLENIYRSRQHCAGQRAEAALRHDGDRHLGGHRGGGHQAVRLPGVLSRPRRGRSLHPGRSVLSELEGAAVRLPGEVHRAGRRGQRVHAAVRCADRQRERWSARALRFAEPSVLVLGVAYKRDVDDLRESPA